MILYSVLDNQKALKNTFHATLLKVEENIRTFQALAQTFKDFSRKNGIQGLFKAMRTRCSDFRSQEVGISEYCTTKTKYLPWEQSKTELKRLSNRGAP